ncbi:MAG TPA: sigma-70 family RNA polymerase sigma factor [Trebonia sp.]|nr:sigma-70 family RNA polymerase sigma factor [Trebonia sp.]
MRDSEVVACIVAGDPGGLAEAYDRYAALIYTYCCSLLHEPADAADVVQDTFLIASDRLAGLRDPDRLRPWLFAVARNECLRRLRDRTSTSAFDDEADLTDETADVGGDAERAELRSLLRAALRGLNAGDRDVIILQVSQGLDVAEVAKVLGVTRNAAHALLSRARSQLHAAVGVLLVSRAGRAQCPVLDELLGGWDGELTVLLRKRLNRHIGTCPICTARRQHEMRPARLLAVTGGAALVGAAAAARHYRAAGVVTASLKHPVLRAAAGRGQVSVLRRAAAATRHGAFGPRGFPQPLNAPHVRSGLSVVAHARVAIATASVAAATATGTLVVLPGGSGGIHFAASGPASGGNAGPGVVPATVVPSPISSAGTAGTPTPGGTSHGQASTTGSGASRGASSAPLGSGQPAPATTPATTGPTTPPATPPAAPTAPASPAPSTTPPSLISATGTISVSPNALLLTPLLGSSSMTITATGGPVSWSISEPSSLIGTVRLSQTSGTLAAGQSVTVKISTTLASIDSVITVSPGNELVPVLLGAL